MQDERGVALVLVVFAIIIVTVLGTTMLETVKGDQTSSANQRTRDGSLQAAEAGVDDYLSKLVDNRVYYLQYVHPAEATRRDSVSPNSVVAASGSCTPSSKPSPVAWAGSRTWTYPNGMDRWCQLASGYEYDLEITAPLTATNNVNAIMIVSTGRKIGSTTGKRTIQVLVDPSSVADYQMISDATVTYGTTATTTGKLYSKANICHQGTAQANFKDAANLYAEGSITCTPTRTVGSGAPAGTPLPTLYDSTNIPTPPKGTNFSSLQVALTDVKRAADTGGIDLDNYAPATYDGWRITFVSDGTALVQSCLKSGSSDFAAAAPTCGGAGQYSNTFTLPSNGAIYATKSVIVSGPGASGINGPSVVNGRVTVASNADIDVAGNISYVNAVSCACGDDVLGLVAQNNVYVADWAPNQLTWRAASIAETGQWRAYNCGSVSGRTGASPASNMTYYGSTVTFGGGCMSSYDNRFYNYDSVLSYLPPPWFPTIDLPYTILLFRELPAS